MNERRLADVRFGAHNGLGSDIASCTLCAMNGHRALSVQRRNDCSVRKEKTIYSRPFGPFVQP